MPEWAQWSSAGAEHPWTVGLEEEVLLLDPRDWSPANRVGDVLAALPEAVADRVCAETHASVVELRTGPHASVAAAVAELASLRRALDHTLRERLGLRAAVAGMHPLATAADVLVSSGARYSEIAGSMRALARREPTLAEHVHVAVPDGEAGVRALNGLRDDLPLLLALSANSPYRRGSDSGFASFRTQIFGMFPRTGIPRRFDRYADYVAAIDPLLRSGAIPDPTFVWWDVRLQPRLGTVEVRVLDAQARIGDVAALAAFVQCLVRLHAESALPSGAGPEVLAENRFLAARDGVQARLIEARTGRRPRAGELLAERLRDCEPFAENLRCARELRAAGDLMGAPGEVRQRRFVAQHGLAELAPWLSGQFRPAPVVVARPAAAGLRLAHAAFEVVDPA
jgi:carboxylate-amine ligase